MSKQAVSQYHKRQLNFDNKVSELIEMANVIRKEHPGCGVEKLYYTLAPDFIGRDRFIDLFMNLGYRLKIPKNYHRTTRSSKFYYPNLIKGMTIQSPSIIWQTDITYFRIGEKFYYGIFIIDVYTKELVGYQVSDHMRASANIKALQMALSNHPAPKIHHSDRGSQYICKEYIQKLKEVGTQVSMGLCAQDNAYAERINQTIKYEYLDFWKPKSFNMLKKQVKNAVEQYNNRRLHNTFRPLKLAPKEFRNYIITLPKQKRPKEIIYTEVENNKTEEASSLSSFKQKQPAGSYLPEIKKVNN